MKEIEVVAVAAEEFAGGIGSRLPAARECQL
jgi:hypothetical protein